MILTKQAEYPSFRKLSSVVEAYLMVGFNEDPNQTFSNDYEKITFDNLISFYKEEIQKPSTFLGIHGDTKRFDVEKLKKIGTVRKLKREDVIKF